MGRSNVLGTASAGRLGLIHENANLRSPTVPGLRCERRDHTRSFALAANRDRSQPVGCWLVCCRLGRKRRQACRGGALTCCLRWIVRRHLGVMSRAVGKATDNNQSGEGSYDPGRVTLIVSRAMRVVPNSRITYGVFLHCQREDAGANSCGNRDRSKDKPGHWGPSHFGISCTLTHRPSVGFRTNDHLGGGLARSQAWPAESSCGSTAGELA